MSLNKDDTARWDYAYTKPNSSYLDIVKQIKLDETIKSNPSTFLAFERLENCIFYMMSADMICKLNLHSILSPILHLKLETIDTYTQSDTHIGTNKIITHINKFLKCHLRLPPSIFRIKGYENINNNEKIAKSTEKLARTLVKYLKYFRKWQLGDKKPLLNLQAIIDDLVNLLFLSSSEKLDTYNNAILHIILVIEAFYGADLLTNFMVLNLIHILIPPPKYIYMPEKNFPKGYLGQLALTTKQIVKMEGQNSGVLHPLFRRIPFRNKIILPGFHDSLFVVRVKEPTQ